MVRTVGEAIDLAGDGAMLSLSIPGLPNEDTISVPGPGFRLPDEPPLTPDAPPRLDQHRDDILAWLAED